MFFIVKNFLCHCFFNFRVKHYIVLLLILQQQQVVARNITGVHILSRQ